MNWTIDAMFEVVVREHASDLVFVPGKPPVVWRSGRMQLTGGEPMTHETIEDMFMPLLTPDQRKCYDTIGDVDFSVGKTDVGRFRINMHKQRGSSCVAVRFVPHDVPGFGTLNLPERILGLAGVSHGLLLVTGGAGMGKSTTLASLIDYMNHTFAYHIITLEDPLEFTFRHDKSIIEQREVGVDCPSFGSALRHVVRQRPDVIMVGEMRDLETIAAALTAAETGHLVMASLHTINAMQTVDRIIDVFPASQQGQIRIQLSGSLQGVVCQSMFHDEKSGGMVPAVEIMVPTAGVRRAIRDKETHLIPGMIETGKSLGMQTMDGAIAELLSQGRISLEAALSKAQNPEKLAKMVA